MLNTLQRESHTHCTQFEIRMNYLKRFDVLSFYSIIKIYYWHHICSAVCCIMPRTVSLLSTHDWYRTLVLHEEFLEHWLFWCWMMCHFSCLTASLSTLEVVCCTLIYNQSKSKAQCSWFIVSLSNGIYIIFVWNAKMNAQLAQVFLLSGFSFLSFVF